MELNQLQWSKPYSHLNPENRKEAEQNGDKDRKAMYKLINNAVYSKIMENLRNRIDVRLIRKKQDYLKSTAKTSYMSQKYLTMI